MVWERSGGGIGNGVVSEEHQKRHKVMGFVGIQTGFGSVGRRRSLRQTWMPSDRQGLQRYVNVIYIYTRTHIQSLNRLFRILDLVFLNYNFISCDNELQFILIPKSTIAM